MQKSTPANRHHQGRGHVEKLITPEMRHQVSQMKHQLHECEGRLADLGYHFNELSEALEIAQASAECLLTDDPFEAWEKVKERRQKDLDTLTDDPFEAWEKVKERRQNYLDTRFPKSATRRQDGRRTYYPQGNVAKLITPEMRRQITKAKKQLDDFVSGLRQFFDNVSKLESLDFALECAEDLQCNEHLETWEARKRRRDEAAGDPDLSDDC